MTFLVHTASAFVFYLLLTTSSGNLFLWSKAELMIGAIFALMTGALTTKLGMKRSVLILSPKRWLLFFVYIAGPFFWGMAKANVDVVYRVVTGRINPGIVKISPNLKTDSGLTLLANSITLTPGTLSVDVDEETNDLYIHWINVRKETLGTMPRDYRHICGTFPVWAKRLAE